jgi:hypothetical protein
MMQQLQQNGISIQQIRAMEEQYSDAAAGSSCNSNTTSSNLDDGVLRIYAKWSQYVSSIQNSARLDAIESLIQILEEWRTETTAKCRSKIKIHPHNNTMDTTVSSSSPPPLVVLTGYHLIWIAYTVANMIPGNKVNSNKLETMGIQRSLVGRESLNLLMSQLGKWVDEPYQSCRSQFHLRICQKLLLKHRKQDHPTLVNL